MDAAAADWPNGVSRGPEVKGPDVFLECRRVPIRFYGVRLDFLVEKMDTLNKLKQFDAYPKTLEDFRVKTWGGATGRRLTDPNRGANGCRWCRQQGKHSLFLYIRSYFTHYSSISLL